MIDVPTYVISGFLDAGKTTFIKPMLVSGDFTQGCRTLFLVCEEGEEEYDPVRLARYYDVFIEYIEDEDDFNPENLSALLKKHNADQVLIEYNGMWQIADLFPRLPEGWNVYQIITLAEAATFEMYAKNMGGLMSEKIMQSDMVILNRCTDELAAALRKRNLKMINRRATYYLDYADGRDEDYDDGTIFPFDLTPDSLVFDDEDFGVFYIDCMDHPERYVGKKVTFRGQVAKNEKFPKGSFVAGRFAMVCCDQDTQFLGMICKGPHENKVDNKDWAMVTAEVRFEYVDIYEDEGPILYTTAVERCDPPKEFYVTF